MITTDLAAELKELDRVYTRRVQQLFKDSIAPLFKQYPSVKGVQWKQYTPYFCDGDPCYFQVNADPDYGLALWFDDTDSFHQWFDWRVRDDDSPEHMSNRPNAASLRPAYDAFAAFLQSLSDEQMQRVIPDEGLISLLRSGELVCEEYDHD